MSSTAKISFLAAIVVVSIVSSPSEASDSQEAMADTVQVVRETGVRLYAYLNGWIDGAGAEPSNVNDDETTAIDWSSCGAIEWAEVARMIGGDGNPIVDGWDRPLEVCVELDNLASGRHIIGVRSAGIDGQFGGPDYAIGPFDEANSPTTDVVWMDGYFMTWPQKPAG